MASITDRLYDLTGTVPFVGAHLFAYEASSQAAILTNLDGTAVLPVGDYVAAAITSGLGEYSLTGLSEGVIYDIYVEPQDGYTFWIPARIPDVVPTATPCILYGTVDPSVNLVWAFLEYPTMVSGGVYIVNGTTFSTISTNGSFSMALWPTSELTPPTLYRVHVGNNVYRGSIPGQPSINLSDWIALSTTIQLV